MKILVACFAASLLLSTGCGAAPHVRSTAAIERVVVYKNGIAYFERGAHLSDGDDLQLAVPPDMVDDLLKSLRVRNARTGETMAIAYPTAAARAGGDGLVDIDIRVTRGAGQDLVMSYFAESPSWKPTYRVALGDDGTVDLEGWAIVDNTSGEDWQSVTLGVASSSALSFRYDLHSLRYVSRTALEPQDRFVQAPPLGGAAIERPEVRARPAEAVAPSGPPIPPGSVPAALEPERLTVHIQGLAAPVRSMLALARERKDIVLVTCLNDKLTQIEAAGKSAEERARAWASAQTNSQVEIAAHERRVLVVLGQRATQLAAESKMCLGAETASIEGTTVTTVIDPGLPPDEENPDGGRVTSGTTEVVRPVVPDQIVENPETPQGSAHFEARDKITLGRSQSAMIAMLKEKTPGEVVYFYDPESSRGSETFAFRAVRFRNPSDSMLESGPITVFGKGRFVGEGFAEPIAAKATALVPFALDRLIVVERKQTEATEIEKVIAMTKQGLSAETRRVARQSYTLSNRGETAAVVFVRRTTPPKYTLRTKPENAEKWREGWLFRVEVPAHGAATLDIEEATPASATVDLHAEAGIALVKAYLARPADAADATSRDALASLLKAAESARTVEETARVRREQMALFQARGKDLIAEIVALRASKADGKLIASLEKKAAEVSAEVSRRTDELARLQQDALLARVTYEDAAMALVLSAPKTGPTTATREAGASPVR